MTEEKPTCKTVYCVHEEDLPYNSHIKCVHPKVMEKIGEILGESISALAGDGDIEVLPALMKEMGVKGHPTGIRNSWFLWPVNFDPVWLVSCDCFEERKEEQADG